MSVTASHPSTTACQGCGSENPSNMAFCLNCGVVLTSPFEAQRRLAGVYKRTCKGCKHADELNYRYCIFCGSQIELVVGRTTRPEALERFTQELSSFDTASSSGLLADGGENARASAVDLPAVPLSATAQASAKATVASGRVSANILLTFLLLGLVAGCGLAYFTRTQIMPLYLRSAAGNNDLLIFTDKKFVNVQVESKERQKLVLAKTGEDGSLLLSELTGGKYWLTFSQEGARNLLKVCDLVKGRLNLIGFGPSGKIVLPLGHK
jgi:hypothetical protein